MKRILLTLGFSILATTMLMSQTNEERRKDIEKRENEQPSKEALERRVSSIARLKKEGVPSVDHLPIIEDSKQAKTRTVDDVAKRAIAVCLTAVKGEGIEQPTIDSLVKKYGAAKFFSPKEAAFINNAHPTQQERINFSWRYECSWVLLWALGYVDKLERPEGACDVAKAVSFLRDRDTAQLLKDAKLPPNRGTS